MYRRILMWSMRGAGRTPSGIHVKSTCWPLRKGVGTAFGFVVRITETRTERKVDEISCCRTNRNLFTHSRNTICFQSRSNFRWHNRIQHKEVLCLDVKLKNFSIMPLGFARAELRFETEHFQSKEAVGAYLSRIEASLSADLGKRHQNGYYGIPFVEVDYYAAAITDPDDQRIVIAEKSRMSSETPFSLNTDCIGSLYHNPIVSLYNDGLRARDPKSKFLSWFTIIEEFLEKNVKLASIFQSRFTDSEIQRIRDFSKKFGERGGALLNATTLTKCSRHEKLSIILTNLGITSVGIGDREIRITPAICKEIIHDRNQLFHRGRMVDESRLYNILYPLATSIVKLSPGLTDSELSTEI